MPELAKLYDINLLSEENMKNFVLPYYNLENAEVTSIKFKDTDKQRAVYRVTDSGKDYCLKKVYFDKGELLFVYSAIEWIYRNGIKVPKILPNKNGGRFVEYENMLFILTPWIYGRKCDYDNKDDIINSCINLAKFHKVSFNFFPIEGSTIRKGCNNLFESINKHFERLLLNSNLAFKYGDYFSKIFLSHFDKGLHLAKISSEMLSTINFENLSISLCHMDYVNKNLIFDDNNDIWIIDFDKCRIDFCIHDLSYFFRRLLKRDKTNWNMDIVLSSLEEYEKIHSLNIDEYKYLLAYLSFPQKYWKISRDYYKNIDKCNKKTFVNMLNRSVKNFDSQIEFVYSFMEHINKKFNIEDRN
ncbi:CotS family spore coat protein [Clostridium sp.]|jgi:CotS family spore coat protein|uniref:CotS family spore coat protein n=1 Tax=Clostridium sp. TaxID=1506 RepID=UPI0039F5A96D